ncbi:MAG: zinc-binding dehydrogenase [Lentisphaerae bacterium]|nr:zinc-binding dehydrogenase [Lentisphaerota bacterium]
MKAAFRKAHAVELREIPVPDPGPCEIRLRVRACGVCGSDLLVKPERAAEAHAFGHEVAGRITALGPCVAGLREGQEVALDSSTPCGRCDNCRNGRADLCTDPHSLWARQSFGFAEEMIAPAASAIPYAGLAPHVACLQEPLGVAIDMVRAAEVVPGVNVLVMGAGPIGLMATALARRAGAGRIAVSQGKDRVARRALALRFGADTLLDPDGGPLEQAAIGFPVDRVLVTAPPRALADAVRVAARGAIIALIGISYGDDRRVAIDVNDLHFKKLQVRGAFLSPAFHGPLALALLRGGEVDGQALVSHRFRLDEVKKALDTAREDPGAVKIVVEP